MNNKTQGGELFERHCANCGVMFKPNSPDTQYLCSNCERASNQRGKWYDNWQQTEPPKFLKLWWIKYLVLLIVTWVVFSSSNWPPNSEADLVLLCYRTPFFGGADAVLLIIFVLFDIAITKRNS